MYRLILILLVGILSSCASGPNPNPGERITDVGWTSGNYVKDWPLVREKAELGQPWAQLRLGIFYVYGWGVEQNFSEAAKWYAKASIQIAEGDWANGKIVGATGKPGYFNQNSDAYMARYNLSEFYLNGRGVQKDNVLAYALIKSVVEAQKGKSIFFCCEFNGGRYISNTDITKRFDEIKNAMSTAELSKADAISEGELVHLLQVASQ
ncbi:tetratricopeptide repeat protein [Mariprofundus erugo]|uniref:tetratricopeptide repeat protein n=1 Tax=Mariprofundus erugo TaxID=2528639 RepID=UPI0019310DC4|nr:SEL1-like repeat protein [Mariprofundus erugo]